MAKSTSRSSFDPSAAFLVLIVLVAVFVTVRFLLPVAIDQAFVATEIPGVDKAEVIGRLK